MLGSDNAMNDNPLFARRVRRRRTMISVNGTRRMRAQTQLLPHRVISLGLGVVVAATAWATPPSRNSVGVTFNVVSLSTTSTVEIRLKPKAAFEVVSVEGGSGVLSMNSSCSFRSVVPGGSYVCRVDVTQKPSEASQTISVVARNSADPGKPAVVEVNHLTLLNASYERPKIGVKAARKALLRSSPGTPPAK